MQKLKLHRRQTVWKAANTDLELELDLDKSPEGNFLAYGDNLIVQSDFYESQKAQAQKAKGTLRTSWSTCARLTVEDPSGEHEE